MLYRILGIFLLVCSSGFIIGCTREEPPPPPPTPELPPPPTPQEIAQGIIDSAQLDMPLPPKDAQFPKAVEKNLMRILSDEKNEHSLTESGKEALQHVIGRVDRRIMDFADAEAWSYVVTYLAAREVLDENNDQYLALRDQAIKELQKPTITVKGLPEIKQTQYAVLNFHIPLTDEKFENLRLRLGDVAHGVKVISIFGKKRGVTLEYLETGEQYVAYLPSNE